MAENKKSFIAYVDWKETFDSLPDDKAGQLIKYLFAYVNDEDPATDDILINAVFANIRQTLKRDLVKYENIRERNRINGAKGGRPLKAKEPTGLSGNPKEPQKADSVSVNDSDTVIKEIKEHPVFNFKKSLLDLGIEKQIVFDWLKVRSKKKASNTETAFKSIKSQLAKSHLSQNESIKIAVEKSWAGFKAEWINNLYETDRKNNKGDFASDTTRRTINKIENGFE